MEKIPKNPRDRALDWEPGGLCFIPSSVAQLCNLGQITSVSPPDFIYLAQKWIQDFTKVSKAVASAGTEVVDPPFTPSLPHLSIPPGHGSSSLL